MLSVVQPKPAIKALREFGWVVGVLLMLVFGSLRPLIHAWGHMSTDSMASVGHALLAHMPIWPWVTGGVLVVMATLVPQWLGPIYRLWMKLGDVLGWVNTRVILSVFFILAVTPVGLLMRAVGYDPMRRQWLPDASTYRVIPTTLSPKHLEVPY